MNRADNTGLLQSERDALVLHLAFTIFCGLALWLAPHPVGPVILALVVLYSLAFVVTGRLRGHAQWLQLAALTMPLSALQVMPDWFLSQGLGILVFPDIGVPRFGTVPVFMAGMWTIPLNVAVLCGDALQRRAGPRAAMITAAAAALVLFGGSEELVWRIPLWYAQRVRMVGHTAVYIVLPEFLLGLATYTAWRLTQSRAWPLKLLAAGAVMLMYAGSAALSWLFIDT